MLLAFLVGLIAAIGCIAVTAIALMCGKWLKQKALEKLRNRENHKVVFADMQMVMADYLKKEADKAYEISMEELEQICEDEPFVTAVLDENGNISEYEGFRAEQYDDNFKLRMKDQNGMIIIGV